MYCKNSFPLNMKLNFSNCSNHSKKISCNSYPQVLCTQSSINYTNQRCHHHDNKGIPLQARYVKTDNTYCRFDHTTDFKFPPLTVGSTVNVCYQEKIHKN